MSQLVFPSNKFAAVDTGSTDVMVAAGGAFVNTFFTAAYVAGALGSALTSQASVARILFAMGRDGILPRKVFGHVSAKFSTPVYAILTVSAISLLAIWIDLAILASVVSFGALVAFSVVNLSVIKHYFIDMRERNVLLNLIAPAIGFLLTAWLWTSLSGTALTIGLIWLAIGIHVAAGRHPRVPADPPRCWTWNTSDPGLSDIPDPLAGFPVTRRPCAAPCCSTRAGLT